MFLISQVFTYLALALIIGGAIGFAMRSCLADREYDDAQDDSLHGTAHHAQEIRHSMMTDSDAIAASRFGEMAPATLERELLSAAPGKPLRARFGSDDLTAIRGITPKIDVWLGLNGITRFSQVADLSAAELYWVVENLPENGNSVYRDNWVAQAQSLARKDQ